ncbi:hypothetical protein AB1N83_007632 [Pleurotus pulmonarius]
MSFRTNDKEKGIATYYWVYLEGVSLDFDSIWTGCGRWVGPRSLEWVPSTRCLIEATEDILVQYGGGNDGLKRTGFVARFADIEALAKNLEYQDGIAHLKMKREFDCGTRTVSLIVHKASEYFQAGAFKLSVIIENICRDEWDKLLKYQQNFKNGRDDYIVRSLLFAWRGNERVIEQVPKSAWQNNQSEVTNNIKHIAYESLPLVFKHRYAQNEAIQRGLSLDDFLWEFPNHHESRVVHRPSTQTDTPLRALRLDVTLTSSTPLFDGQAVWLSITGIDLTLTSITRSPTCPNTFSSCTLRLDPPYAALANATIPNHSSQIIEISPNSQLADCVISTSGPIHVNGPLQIMGSTMMGDVFSAPIYGGNVGGRNNTNHSPLTAEAVASAVLRALDSRLCDGGSFVPQTEAGRKRKRDAREDIEGPTILGDPSKRRKEEAHQSSSNVR